jgi:4'-phosphopantetheinyl transferase
MLTDLRPFGVSLDCEDVAVWFQETASLAPGAVEELSLLLSGDERRRAARFVFDRDRRDFTAAHALARRALSLVAAIEPQAWRFDVSLHGKPSVVREQAGTPALAINMSHTHGLVACAVALGRRLGIDVEHVDRCTDRHAIAKRYFSPSELTMLEGCDERTAATRFIELWTLKESFIKAVGTGLAHGLRSFGFEFRERRQLHFVPPPGTAADTWQFALYEPSAGYRLAVAVDRSERASSPCRIVLRDGATNEARDVGPLRASTPCPDE